MRTAPSYGRQRYDRRRHHDDPQGETRERSGPVLRLRPSEIANMSSNAPTRRQYGRANKTRITPRRSWAEMATDLELAVDDLLTDIEEGNGVAEGALDALKKVSDIVRAHIQVERKSDDGGGAVDFTVKP